jgi:Exostosin family
MTTTLIALHSVENASRIYREDINEASAEVWLHRGMASLTYEQGQTMDPTEADVFLIPGYLRLRDTLPPEDKIDMYQEVMNAVVDKSKPHVWMSPAENPGVCTNLGITDLVKKLRGHLTDYYSLGLERNSAWSGGVTVDRIVPIPYVLRPSVPNDQMASSFSNNRTENFVFFRADRRRMAQEWAGCDRAIAAPLFGRPDMDIGLSGKKAPPGGGGRLSQEQYNHRMSTSDYCLVMCGDTPTTRSLVSSVMAGCIPILVGRWWHGFCDPPCNRKWGWDIANLPHFPFADQINWDLLPVANHSQFEKDPNATLTALFQQHPKERKDKIRAEMKRVQKWLVYGWGDPVTSTIFGDVYTHVWDSILHHVGLLTATKVIE